MFRFLAFLIFAVAIACTMPARAGDVTYARSVAEFGPVPVVGADKSSNNTDAIGHLFNLQSGWYNGPDYQSCTILVDAVPTGFLQCMHRVSVLCGKAGVIYSRGVAQIDEPFTSPLLLAIYTPPSLVPTGYIDIGSLTSGPPGSAAMIGINEPASAWVKAASFSGSWCPELLPPPVTSSSTSLARWCRLHPDVPACRG
jgi:hypothetical protein